MGRRSDGLRVSWWDRMLIGIAPRWGLERVRARASVQVIARHFDAAQGSRRTSGWPRSSSDANVANGPALPALRELSRDLRRNNGWAKRGVQGITNNTVGWGILAKPNDRSRLRSEQALALWNDWACCTACDYDGQLNWYGLQRLAMDTIVEAGEVLVVRQPAATADGLPIPIRLQVLEPDYLDISRNGITGPGGGPVIDGIEFDRQGRRVAYWLFTAHPGSVRLLTTKFESVRVPADRVLHVYRVDRPGQVRGVPWLAAAITRLKDFDDFEDAELMQQKMAACFGAFVSDTDDGNVSIGEPEQDDDGNEIDHLEPGHVQYLTPGQSVQFATPPRAQDGQFSVRALRRVAVALGIPYEVLSGDYSQVNYSSARMARLEFKANIDEWREHMLLSKLCGGVWRWAMEYVAALRGWPTIPTAEWACPPMTILEPDKEALAYTRMIRAGLMTWAQAVRELGYDPRAHLTEIAEYNELLDKAGIVLDSDPRRTNQAGQQQIASAGGGGAGDGSGGDEGDGGEGDGGDEEGAPDDAEDEDSPAGAGAEDGEDDAADDGEDDEDHPSAVA